MASAPQANDVLRRQMLFISAPPLPEHSASASQSRFSRTVLLDTRHESVLHASRHLEALARSSDCSSADELREAFVTCCSSTQRFPVPEVSLAEFMNIFYAHMRHHTDGDGALSGEYILRAISIFFVCERSEAQQRYLAPLVELGVLQSVDASRFVCHGPQPPQLHHLPLRELLSRFLCIFCHQTCMEGGNELIYLSHSRWVFAPRPSDQEVPAALVDAPFSPFPETLRRGLLGPLMQFATTFCVADCRLRGARASDVCIVRLNGVKLALCQLTPSNVSLLALNPETGSLDRRDCPTTLMFGFPEDFSDIALRLTIQRLLDAAEMRTGPRIDLSARLGQSPEAFRRRCRALGRTLFRMLCSTLYCPAAGAACAFAPGGAADIFGCVPQSVHRGALQQIAPRVAPLPPQTFALAAALMCDWARAVAPSGAVRAAVLLAGPFVLLSDAHPHVSALLCMDAARETRGTACDSQLPCGAMADDIFGGDSAASSSSASTCSGSSSDCAEERHRDAQEKCKSIGADDLLWGRTIRTVPGAVLRVRWRYFGAALVRLFRSGTGCVQAADARGKFFRTVFVSSCGVQLVMIVGEGTDAATSAPRGDDAEWRALTEQCLSVLVTRDHTMATLAAAAEHNALCRSDASKRTECAESFCLRRSVGGACEAMRAGTVDCPQAFARDALDLHALLGAPLVPAGNARGDISPFAFEHLPVTRVVLGRGAFGTRGVAFGQRAGGEDYFFAPPQGSVAAFARVEEEFAAFMKAQETECDTVF